MAAPPSRFRRPPALAPLLGVAALSLLFTFTVSDTHAATRGPAGLEGGGHVAVTELQGQRTLFWSVDAGDPRRRSLLGQTEHATGFGVKAQASPDGRYLAYLAFPPGGQEPTTDAELWVLDTGTGGQRRLGVGLDLMGAPRWTPDGSRVVARHTAVQGTKRDFSLLAFDAATTDGPAATLASVAGVDWAGAVGWDRGVFTYATIDDRGTWLHSTGEPLRLSGGIARDFSLAPEGGRLSFAEVPGPNSPGLRIMAADLSTRTLSVVPTGRGAFNPVWTPGGTLTVGGASEQPALQGAAMTLDPAGATSRPSVLRAGPGQFLAPLEWNAGGGMLAARVLSGTADKPGADSLALVDGATGVARPLGFEGYAAFAGWLP